MIVQVKRITVTQDQSIPFDKSARQALHFGCCSACLRNHLMITQFLGKLHRTAPPPPTLH
jgi:hypothetical protein